MSDNKNGIVASAMNYAVPLGLFWIFKYLFVIIGDYSELSKYIANLLSIGTPVIYYLLLCRYRDKTLGGQIDYGNSVLFSFLLFLFASLLEVTMVALHIFIINPAFLSHLSDQMLEFADKFENVLGSGYKEQVKVAASNMGGYYLMSTLVSNLFVGLFLSVILSFFVSRPKSDKY